MCGNVLGQCCVVCRASLARLFTTAWLGAQGGEHAGLDAALLTCQDYVEEVQAIAHPRVFAMFQKCLLRHLVCCIAARMLCSACPFDRAWQRRAALEERRLRHFALGHLPAVADMVVQYLSMLSLLRTMLCVPDAASVATAYEQVRPAMLVAKLKQMSIWQHSQCILQQSGAGTLEAYRLIMQFVAQSRLVHCS